MALTPIEQVRLLVGDTTSNPFYPILSDEEYQEFLDLNNQNVPAAAKMAAISILMLISAFPFRERVSEVEVWNNYATNYIKALTFFINNPSQLIPNGITPWAGGISREDICANNSNKDNVSSPLDSIYTCDSDDPCYNKCGC